MQKWELSEEIIRKVKFLNLCKVECEVLNIVMGCIYDYKVSKLVENIDR